MRSAYTSNIILIAIATVIGGVINYLVHPIAVRHLSVQDFGQFAALLSMINIIGFIISAGSIITLKLIAQHDNKLDFMYYLKHKLQRPLLSIGVMVWIVWSLWSNRIARSLNITNPRAIVLMLASVITSIYSVVLSAIMQSAWWFKQIAWLGVLWSLLRFVAVIISIYRFSTTSSTIAAVVISGIIGFIITEVIVSTKLKQHHHTILDYDGTLAHQVRFYAKSYLYLILVTVMIGILTNADVLLVQHFFGGEISGNYAGVAVIAKFVVFIWLAAETVLLPKLFNTQLPTTRRQVLTIIWLLRGFSVAALAGSWLLGTQVLALLKPWLEIYHTLLLWVILISCCILHLSITSKTLVNRGSTTTLWILACGSLLRYLLGTVSIDLNEFVSRSIIILLIMTITLESLWIYQSSQNISIPTAN